MRRCPECGQENPASARFCNSCATPLGPESPERRKLATMLFCDMSGSTAMGERVDAESVRDLMFSYFHEMRGAIERHGGTVEKFIGDAVMAVFGVPLAHEDDALRAIRAAWEMQDRLGVLNDLLEQRFGSRIALRIGVNTGEVVAGEATSRQALVTGDAVNVAARLEQAASPGEILIGEQTFQLVRDAVSAEPVEPLSLKGKSEPLPAYRLTHVEDAAPARARRLDTPMVGRDQELDLLVGKLAEAKAGHCAMATVAGEPGVGKSRLAAELLASAEGEFQILSGRCLQYGEGITYWPIAEIVRQAAGIRDEHRREEALERIEALVPGETAQVLAQAMGLAEGEASTEEIAAAFHELIGALAARRPLVLFLDDIHWGEASLLDLVAALPEAVGAARILVLCLTRPDLLDEHPDWQVTVRLEGLLETESATLIGQMLGGTALPMGLAERISAAAAGNPLFVEELVGMLIDDGVLERRNGTWTADPSRVELTIPPTLRELLGARLDRMPPGERSALERGAVEGQIFHRGAVLVLSEEAERPAIPECLQALVEREYIRPATASFADEGAFRVRHILIRDAAYEGIPKKLRASLHQRFADWLEGKAGERLSEYDEILGHHLEQAYLYSEELGPPDEETRGLALRAADKLGAPGRRAFARRDFAAVTLLLRAAALLPERDAIRIEHRQAAGELLADAGDFERARTIFVEVEEEATASGQRHLAARASGFLSWIRLLTDPSYGGAKALEVCEELEPIFREFGDEHGLARVHDSRAYVHDIRRQSAIVEREALIAIEHARRAGDRRLEIEHMYWLIWQLPQGPTPVEEAIRECHRLHEGLQGDHAAEAVFRESLAQLEAMRGRFDEARRLAASSMEIRAEIGMHGLRRRGLVILAMVELSAGDVAAAERALRTANEEAQGGDLEAVSNSASVLAELLIAEERVEEAEPFCREAEEAAVGDAVVQQVRWRCARAKLLIKKGGAGESTALAREAVELTKDTDDLNLQATARLTLADVLAAAGSLAEAVQVAKEALDLYGRKGNIVWAEKARGLIEDLGLQEPSRGSSTR